MSIIMVRAPVRISFVGGGTDFSDFYTKTSGRVISAAIDKYIYVTLNKPPLLRNVSVRYSKVESVVHPSELENDRVREALLDMGILSHIDVATFSDVPVKTGLGSSSSFSVALMKALFSYKGEDVGWRDLAERAARLEIDLVKEPIGKQDHYASALGGLNVFQFNADHSVEVESLCLGDELGLEFEKRLFVFYTGVSRFASSVLVEQVANIGRKFEILKKMAASVFDFKDSLLAGDWISLGAILHEGWIRKKQLASNLSNDIIDGFYEAGISAGAWGGKVLGAGGGGCMIFIVPPEKKDAVRNSVSSFAKKSNLNDYIEIPVRLVRGGVEVLLNSAH